MDAVEYLKAKGRMTKNCTIPCRECNFYEFYINNDKYIRCVDFEWNNPEECVEIVEKWAKENPVKTYKSVFFEKFPNARKSIDGYPVMTVYDICGGSLVKIGEYKKHGTKNTKNQDLNPAEQIK